MNVSQLTGLIALVVAAAAGPISAQLTARNERQRQNAAFDQQRRAAKEDATTADEREATKNARADAREAVEAAKAEVEARKVFLAKVLALGSQFLRASRDDRVAILNELAAHGGEALLLPDDGFRGTFSTFIGRCHDVVYWSDDEKVAKRLREAESLFDQLCNDARVMLGQPSDRIRVRVMS